MDEGKKIRIAVVVFEDIHTAMGTSVRVHRLLDFLSSISNVTVISSSNKTQSRLIDTNVIHTINLGAGLLIYKSMPFLFKPIPIILWNIKLAFVLLTNKFDVVFCAFEWLGYLTIYLVSKIKGYSIVFEVHSIISEDMEERGHPGPLLKMERSFEKFIGKHSNLMITLSKNTFDFYQKYTAKIELTHVFVDTEIFKNTGRLKDDGSISIGLIGPFAAKDTRGQYALNFIIDRITDFDDRIKFVVIGHCEKPIGNNRITYTGFLDSLHDYVDQLSRLDAVLVPEGVSTTGPLNKILEPMSCSVPVFATPKAMLGLYWIIPGKDIFVFEEDEMVEKINKLVFDDELMAEIGKNARDTIEKYHSRKANEKKLASIMKSITGMQHNRELPPEK